jgi:Transposase DDE domain
VSSGKTPGKPGSTGRWRIARKVAPDRVISTVDLQARHARKSSEGRRDGYRAHVAAEPETGILMEWYGDSAYGTAQLRAAIAGAGHAAVIKPRSLRPAVRGGFTVDDFAVDHAAGTVTCPGAVTRPVSAAGVVTFGAACRACPLRARCTTRRNGRHVTVGDHDALLRQARRDWVDNPDLRERYRRHRPNVERVISQLASRGGAWALAAN